MKGCEISWAGLAPPTLPLSPTKRARGLWLCRTPTQVLRDSHLTGWRRGFTKVHCRGGPSRRVSIPVIYASTQSLIPHLPTHSPTHLSIHPPTHSSPVLSSISHSSNHRPSSHPPPHVPHSPTHPFIYPSLYLPTYWWIIQQNAY